MRLYEPAALESLVAVAEEGSFQRAAQRLGLTQSAVSQRLHSLEAQAGTILVVRSRPARLTPAGEVMARHARRAQTLEADLRQQLRALLAAEPA
jgi:LysR family transcriptional regulator (chromosome initiation inhibitor)